MSKMPQKTGLWASKMLDNNKVMSYISAKVSKGASFIDALVEYSKEFNVDIEALADVVKKTEFLKANVTEEAENLNLIEKTNRLHIFDD
jgi:alkyl hydroperoxide reductase subunit AhpF